MSKRSILVAAVLAVLACAGMAYVIWTQIGPADGPGGRGPGGSAAAAPGEIERPVESPTATATGDPSGTSGGAGVEAVSRTAGERPGESDDSSSGDEPEPDETERAGRGAGALVAFVDNEDGEPLSGVQVKLTSGRSVFTAVTGRKGDVEFEKLPAGSYQFHISAADHPMLRSKRRHVVEANSRSELRIVLRSPEHAISGRVLDPQGRPVPEIGLRCTPLDRSDDALTLLAIDAERIVTDDEGRFEITRLAGGEYVLETIVTEGYSLARLNVMAPSDSIDLVVYEERSVEFIGVVSDATGKPIEGAVVAPASLSARGSSDANGAYRVVVPYRDAYNTTIVLTAEKSGYSTEQESVKIGAEVDDVSAGGAAPEDDTTPVIEVDFTLEAIADAATLVGRLRDAEGKPIPSERVSLRSPRLNIRRNVLSDPRGEFTIKDLRAGDDYRLQVYPRSGFKDFTQSALSLEEGRNEIDIVLDPLHEGELAGVLLDTDGRPLPNFSFHVRSRESLANSVPATTDAAGRFDIVVPSGQLILETRTLPKVTVHGIVVAPDESAQVEIPIGVGDQFVSGTVTSKSSAPGVQHEPIPGARVIVTWSRTLGRVRSTVYQEAVTDEHGRFSVSGFGPGECSASVTVPGHRSKRVPFAVKRGEEPEELEVLMLPLGDGAMPEIPRAR